VPIWQGEAMTVRSLLCWGTVEGAPVHELVVTAAHAGFTGVSVTPAMYFASRSLGRSDHDLRVELDDLGVSVMVIDPLITGLPGIPSPDDVGPRFRSTFVHDEHDCYRAAEAVGAGAINVAHYLGAPTELGVLADAIGAMAERAAARGIDVLVESMPDGAIPDVTAAAAIVAAVGADNCGASLDHPCGTAQRRPRRRSRLGCAATHTRSAHARRRCHPARRDRGDRAGELPGCDPRHRGVQP
jgi:sugar phosphate isomerase/epimerase